MLNVKLEKEKKGFIFNYQETDVNVKLSNILGDKFRKYRQDFNKSKSFLETGFIPDFPITVSLELLNRCNLNCIMCNKEHFAQNKTELSIDTIKRILEECKESNLQSMIIGLGSEPLLYKNINKVIAMLRRAEIMDVFLGTNGVLLNGEIIELIIQNKITRVEISLDAATTETYKKVRGMDKLEAIEKNINSLIELKKKHNSLLPMIRLCFVVQDENKYEVDAFVEKWKGKADYIDFQRLSYFRPDKEKNKIRMDLIKGSFCSNPFYSLNIWSNGNVTPCCCYYGEKLVAGNIYHESLKDIWNKKEIKTIREEIASEKFNTTCQKCLYYVDRDIIKDVFRNNKRGLS